MGRVRLAKGSSSTQKDEIETLTRFGHGLISSYRAIEADAHAATAAQLGGLQASLRGGRRKAALKPRKISGGPRSVR